MQHAAALLVTQVWVVSSTHVMVTAGTGDEHLSWKCPIAEAPRVGKSIAVLIRSHPPTKSLNRVLGIEQRG